MQITLTNFDKQLDKELESNPVLVLVIDRLVDDVSQLRKELDSLKVLIHEKGGDCK